MESTHKMVAGGLGSAVRTVGLVFQVFSKKLATVCEVVLATASLRAEWRQNTFGVSKFKGAIHLIGADMVEAFAFIFLR